MSEFSTDTGRTSETLYGTSEIPDGYYRYQRNARRLQVEYTGSPDIFLDKAKEQEFAQIIEAANFAQEGLAELAETDEERAVAERERYEPLFAAAAQAKRTLIETNLRFAAYYARASMNILSPTNDGFTDIPSRGRPGAYGDITKLRSRYADLEDRTGVANVALVKAAETFTPKQDANGQPVSFLSHAKYQIHSALSKYVKTEETPGWYVNANQVDKLYAAQRKSATTSPPEQERLDEMSKGRYTVPLDEVPLLMEESDDTALYPLELADVVPDVNGEPLDIEVLYKLREEQIASVLDTLSEREAGVIRMRFGFGDNTPKTMEEIGLVYGVTRERIRQIELKTMGKLRHRSRSQTLRGYMDLDSDPASETGPLTLRPVVPGVANLRTSRDVARKGMYPAETPDEGLTLDDEIVLEKESWQLSPDEPWDLQPARERTAQTFEQIARQFELLLHNAPVYMFQRSFAKEMESSHPVVLAETISEQLGASLTSGHIEDFWNHNIADYVRSLQEQLGEDFSLDRVSALFSLLFAERMREDDQVELLIPPELDGKLNGVGAGLQAGELVLRGSVGDFTGRNMAGVASIITHGSVGDFDATQAPGVASLEVTGNAGHFAGSQLDESSSVHIHGSVGDFCGQGLRGVDAFIGVDGDAGEDVGEGALRGVIEIRGTGYSAHPDSAALINGEFAQWIDHTDRQAAVETATRLGQLAVEHRDGTHLVEQMLKHRPKDAEAIIAKIDAVAQSIDAALLEQVTKMPMRSEQPPERLLFEQACAWFGISVEELNEYLEEVGHPEGADLMSSDIAVLTELYPELQIEMVQEGYTSIEGLIQKLSIRDSPQRLLRFLIKHNIPLYEFRDVDGRVKYFINDESYVENSK